MASGGPVVTLIFAGDASRLRRTLNDVSGSLVKSVAAVGALGAAGAAASAAVAGASLAAVGLFAGLGIAAAAQNETVKRSYSDLKAHVVAETQAMAAPIVPVLNSIAQRARSTFDQIAPSLAAGFAIVAPMIDQMATGVLSFVTNVMPGLMASLRAAEPIVHVLSTGIAGMGTAVSQFFTNVATGAPGATVGFRALFDLINGLLPIIGQLVADIANGLGPAFAAMVPYLISSVQWFRDQLAPALMLVGGFITQHTGLVMGLAGVLLGLAVAVKAVTVGIAIYNGIQAAIRGATMAWAAAQWVLNSALFANPIGIVVLAIIALIAIFAVAWASSEQFRAVVVGVFNTVRAAVGSAVAQVVGFVTRLVNGFRSAGATIGSIFSAVGRAISAPFIAAFQAIRSMWNNTVGRISFTIPSWVPLVGGRGFSMPRFHTGGVVPGAPGSETLAVLQAGETVLPTQGSRNPGVGGGGTITFAGNLDSAFASAFMRMVREGKIQVA